MTTCTLLVAHKGVAASVRQRWRVTPTGLSYGVNGGGQRHQYWLQRLGGVPTRVSTRSDLLIAEGEYAIAELDGYLWALTTEAAPEDEFSGASRVAKWLAAEQAEAEALAATESVPE
jgi:hypothetical protein